VELREIEVFLVLAEELHFGRTAARLHLSQARVSQTVRALERQIGGQLFARTSRRVLLTPLGEQLRARLRPGYDQILRAFDEVQTAAAGITGELRISRSSYAAGGSLLLEIIRSFEARHPGCRVVVGEPEPVTIIQSLRNGDLDLIVYWVPLDEPDLVEGPVLSTEERIVFVPRGHELASRGSVTLEDLGDYCVPELPATVPKAVVDAYFPPRTPSGRPIRRSGYAESPSRAMELVASGQLVYPTIAATAKHYSHPDLVWRPLAGLPPVVSALVWAAGAESATIRAFADEAVTVCREAGQPTPARAPAAPANEPAE
jgi:DNA-binding transcriptional LysR family regulator